jgi:osmotically-inducible protein OsmY
MGRSRRIGALVGATAFGALLEYFFLDTQHATRRRHTVRDRVLATIRRRARASVRRAKYIEGVAEGVAHKAAHALPGTHGHREELDDVTLAQKVESTAFRKARVPTGQVSVNAEKGIVFLRGELDSEEKIEALVRHVAAVEGVHEVKNLLHTATRPPAPRN